MPDPTLKYFDKAEIVTAGKEVDRYNRIRVDALIGHVTVVLYDVTGAYVKLHPVVQEVGRIAERKVETVITVIGHNALGINRCGRKESLVLVRSGRKSDRVSKNQSCIKEFFRFETGACSVVQKRPPT